MPRIIAIFTEDGLDQICETLPDARRECRDLRAMGCTVAYQELDSEADADAIADIIREEGVAPKAAISQFFLERLQSALSADVAAEKAARYPETQDQPAECVLSVGADDLERTHLGYLGRTGHIVLSAEHAATFPDPQAARDAATASDLEGVRLYVKPVAEIQDEQPAADKPVTSHYRGGALMTPDELIQEALDLEDAADELRHAGFGSQPEMIAIAREFRAQAAHLATAGV